MKERLPSSTSATNELAINERAMDATGSDGVISFCAMDAEMET
jgi:hypothetical protein